MLKRKTYKVYNYDLWRDDNSYYVNDIFETDITITINDYTSDKEIIKALKKEGLLRRNLRYSSFEVYGDTDNLYVDYYSQRTGLMPVCELRRIN